VQPASRLPPKMRDPGEELDALAREGLRRRLRPLGSPQGPRVKLADHDREEVLNFSSNDYLGFASCPELAARFAEHLARHGAGSGASRLVCGTLAPHLELEEKLAEMKRSEAALVFSSGFAAATGTIPALCRKGDVVVLDKLCHASLIDGARLSGADLRVFPHNDLDRLEHLLRWARERTAPADGRVLVVTESVFSMDGDRAPLAPICELKDRYGALLLLDEAHALGVIGPEGRGLAAEESLEERVDLQMGTLSKSLGLSGGYLCAARPWIDLLVNRARSFIYSTAPSPALAATAAEALDRLRGGEGDLRRQRLRSHLARFPGPPASAIVPWILGSNESALAAAESLLEKGFLVPAIRYPTVPRGSARLRLTLSAAHQPEEVGALVEALASVAKSVPRGE